MTDAMKSLVKKLGQDEALLNKMKVCKSPEEAFAVANAAVGGLSMDEFVSTMKKINDSLTKNKGELSDADLEQVAGGWSETETVAVVTATVSAAGPAAAAAI